MRRLTRRTTIAVAVGAVTCAAAALASNLGAAQSRSTGVVTGEVRSNGDTPIVVYLESESRARRSRRSRETARMVQRDRQFRPSVLAVPRGGEVDFPNDDQIYHNVFSLSRTKRFDLGLYRGGTSKTVRFPRAGVVDVYCNIHPEMVAHILVVDTPHYTLGTPGGRFVLTDVPAGTHTLVGWSRYGEPFRRRITVERGQTTTVDVSVRTGAAPRRHLKKDGTPYGRYR